jgi:hypothetical protein
LLTTFGDEDVLLFVPYEVCFWLEHPEAKIKIAMLYTTNLQVINWLFQDEWVR